MAGAAVTVPVLAAAVPVAANTHICWYKRSAAHCYCSGWHGAGSSVAVAAADDAPFETGFVGSNIAGVDALVAFDENESADGVADEWVHDVLVKLHEDEHGSVRVKTIGDAALDCGHCDCQSGCCHWHSHSIVGPGCQTDDRLRGLRCYGYCGGGCARVL